MKCARCSAEFSPKHSSAKFCSPKCRSAASVADRDARSAPRDCRRCGREFRRQRSGGFCALLCLNEYERERAKIFDKKCAQCGGTYRRRPSQEIGGFCSGACKVAWRHAQPKPPTPPKACRACGALFDPAGHRRIFCSRDCCKSWYSANAADKYRGRYRGRQGHRKRARHFGVHAEVVDRRKVFDRDGWKCQVCGCNTPKRLRGTNHPRAPELDHRIAMSRGGSHTYENVQCCCRACNSAKGSTRVVGQMPLFARPA